MKLKERKLKYDCLEVGDVVKLKWYSPTRGGVFVISGTDVVGKYICVNIFNGEHTYILSTTINDGLDLTIHQLAKQTNANLVTYLGRITQNTNDDNIFRIIIKSPNPDVTYSKHEVTKYCYDCIYFKGLYNKNIVFCSCEKEMCATCIPTNVDGTDMVKKEVNHESKS